MLDSRLKLDYYEENNWDRGFIDEIKEAVYTIYNHNYMPAVYEPNNNQEASCDDDDLLDHIFGKRRKIDQQNVIELYLKAPQAMRKQDVLLWWKVHETEYPHLATMARDYLAVSATSVPVERIFSEGTDLIFAKRCSLGTDTICACMCLRSSWA